MTLRQLLATFLLVLAGCGVQSGTDNGTHEDIWTFTDALMDTVVPDGIDDDGFHAVDLGLDGYEGSEDTADAESVDAVDDIQATDAALDAPDTDPVAVEYAERIADLRSQKDLLLIEYDDFGGWKNCPEAIKPSAGTGYFRVEKLNGAWWFVSPDGNPFISKGVTDINYLGATLSDDEWHQILVDKYGDEATWADAAVTRFDGWGFNTVGPWSSGSIMGRRTQAAVILDAAGHAPRYPDAIVTDYWSQDFIDNVGVRFTERALPYVESPLFLGYFLDNELVWGPDWRDSKTLLQLYLGFPAEAPGRLAAIQHLKDSAETVETFNSTWGTSIVDWSEVDLLDLSMFSPVTSQAIEVSELFQVLVFRKYASIAVAEVRALDPNHLILGCRFADYPGDALMRAAVDYFDVISMASYREFPPISELDNLWSELDMPILIEEFSFVAADSGLMNAITWAPIAATQKGRALAFDRFIEPFMRRPYAVAFHWYKWMDNPALESNIANGVNHGLVSGNDDPYADFVNFTSEFNGLVESWHYAGDNN